MLEFLNAINSLLIVMFSAVVALATAVYAVLTWKLVSETRKMREAQTEPFISVRLKSKEEYIGFVDLIIENIGLGPAYNLRFEVNPDFEFNKGRTLSEVSFIKNGLRYLSPNNKIVYFLLSLIGKVEELEKTSIEITVKYENCLGKSYQKTYTLDFSELLGLRRVGEPPLQNIANTIEKIQKELHPILTGTKKLNVITHRKETLEKKEKKLIEQAKKVIEKQKQKKE